MGIKIPYIEHATVGEIAENFARVRRAAKDDAYQLAKGNGGLHEWHLVSRAPQFKF